jgi:hypothetical protein
MTFYFCCDIIENVRGDKMIEVAKKYKLLSDTNRLQMIALLIERCVSKGEFAEELNLHPTTIAFHIRKLLQENWIELTSSKYCLKKNILTDCMQQEIKDAFHLLKEESANKQFVQKVLTSFFTSDGKLKNIPAQRKKRLIVLKEIANSFEIKRVYTEKEVNEILREFYEDVCTLRREFIMNKLFTRENGIYQKIN